jgi:hypothetical protein
MQPLSETDEDMMMMNYTIDNTSTSDLTLLQQQKRSSTTSSIDSSALSLSVEDESVIEQRHAQAAKREAAIQDVHDGLTDGLTNDPAALLETAAASNGSSNGSTVGHSHLPADLGPAVTRAKLPASVAAAMSLKSGQYHGQIVTLIRPKHSERGRLLVANRQLYFVPDENNSSGDGGDASNSGVTDDSYNTKTPTIKVLQW